MIPYPSPEQHQFGDVDGDGASEDLARAADRQKAVAWCVEEMLRRWQGRIGARFKLWGFYWMNESTGPRDAPIIRFAAASSPRGSMHWPQPAAAQCGVAGR